MCRWGNAGNQSKMSHRAADFGNFVAYSDDFGATWEATAPIRDQGWNECFLALLPGSGRLLEISRRTNPDPSVPKDKAYPAHTYAYIVFEDDTLAKHTPVTTLGPPGQVETPICEASLVAHGPALYLSHPQSNHSRTNLVIHRSLDEGRTWPHFTVVAGPDTGAGYSSMVATAQGLLIAYNQWPLTPKQSSSAGPGQYIRFQAVPYDGPRWQRGQATPGHAGG